MSTKGNLRNDILTSVETLIETRGVNSFSLRDICEMLDISMGSLYYHFKTKDSIILAIIEKHFAMLDEEYTKWLIRHKGKEDLTKDRFIDTIIYKGIELFNSYKMHIYLINECMRSNSEIKERYRALLDSWYDKILDGVRQVYGDREDARSIAYLLMLIIEGLTIRSALDDRKDEEEKEMKSLLKEM